MSPYYSKQSSLISNFSDLQTVCGIPILPLRGSAMARTGPCPILNDPHYTDIISESLEYFRFNALVKSRFDLKSGQDKILIHITLWIHHCLREMGNIHFASVDELTQFLVSLPRTDFLSKTQFLFSKPFSKKDQILFREYMDQIQLETCHRLAALLWSPQTPPNKYWLQYGQINILGI
jgi:hypothetical protein